MTSESRLAQLVDSLRIAGIEFVVMGGHAVRYYGVGRNTVDFDFCANLASTAELRERIRRLPSLSNCIEGPSWRPNDFIRFDIGRLPDGREEWLEFWLHNHLLPPFDDLRNRQEIGSYGGTHIPFIGLSDLLRSKETERESDWQDITLLEEIQDSRHLAVARDDQTIIHCLTHLRSRRGFERARDMGLFHQLQCVTAAITNCRHPVSFIFLRPLMPQVQRSSHFGTIIDWSALPSIAQADFGSQRHLAVVEIIRRAYRRHAMDADRADKQLRLHQR